MTARVRAEAVKYVNEHTGRAGNIGSGPFSEHLYDDEICTGIGDFVPRMGIALQVAWECSLFGSLIVLSARK